MEAIELARKLGKAIQADEKYQRLVKASKANDDDMSLQNMIGEYQGWHTKLNRLNRGGSPDRVELIDPEIGERLDELKKQIMERGTMVEYSSAKQEVDKLVDFINDIIVGSLNGEDPDSIMETDSSEPANS